MNIGGYRFQWVMITSLYKGQLMKGTLKYETYQGVKKEVIYEDSRWFGLEQESSYYCANGDEYIKRGERVYKVYPSGTKKVGQTRW